MNRVLKQEDGCWIWQAGTSMLAMNGWPHKGYPFVYYKGKGLRVHRIMYEQFVGPIPKKLFICHKCDIKQCVNPDHLFAGTQLDNMKDWSQKRHART
jgi:hypothetical protein